MQMTALVKGSVQEVYEHCFLRLTWSCMQGAVPVHRRALWSKFDSLFLRVKIDFKLSLAVLQCPFGDI